MKRLAIPTKHGYLACMVTTYLDFEKPLAELETKIAELEAVAAQEGGPQITDELKKPRNS